MRLKTFIFPVMALLLLAACGRSTPPGADIAGGGIPGHNYSYLRWADGARLLFWYEEVNEGGCRGSGSTEDPVYRVECSAELPDGRLLQWEAATTDGQNIELIIDGAAYDAAAGNVFLLNTAGGRTAVTQLPRDLTDLQMEHDEIVAFSQIDPEIGLFLLGAR